MTHLRPRGSAAWRWAMACAATRRRLQARGWLSDADCARSFVVACRFRLPDMRFLGHAVFASVADFELAACLQHLDRKRAVHLDGPLYTCAAGQRWQPQALYDRTWSGIIGRPLFARLGTLEDQVGEPG